MLKKIITNTIANYLLKAIQLFLNLLAIPILINNLGEEGFGIILFASIVVGYFNILELGITDGVTKYVSQYLESKEYHKIQSITIQFSSIYLEADWDGDGVTNGQAITDNTNPEDSCAFDSNNVTVEESGAYLISDCDGDGVINAQ